MKLAITGSRTFTDKGSLAAAIADINPSAIVTSEANGADAMAVEYAKAHDIPSTVVLPKFKTDKTIKYHPRYFHMRNREIVDQADMVLAFWDGMSRGTRSTIDYAKKQNKQLRIIRY